MIVKKPMRNIEVPSDRRVLSGGEFCRQPQLSVCLALLLTLLLVTCSPAVSSDLQLEIQCPDTITARLEVLVTMTFTNVGDSNIVLYSFNGKIQPAIGGILQFQIVHNDSDTLVYRRIGATPLYPHERDTATLAPDQSFREEVNLTSYYVDPNVEDQPIVDSTSFIGTRAWQPGTYRVRCRYEYKHEPSFKGGRDLWRGVATSNVIQFVVNR